jgi:hypothetical protein
MTVEIEKFSKTEGFSYRVLEVFRNLVCSTLEKKLAYIRGEELSSGEDSDDSDTTTDLVANVAEFERRASTVNITEDPEDSSAARNIYEPKEICTDDHSGRGFAGTSLRLFPNVRETKIDLGEESVWFKIFGINKRVGTVVTMWLGPNRRLNRYLSFQYTRLIGSIEGEVVSSKVYSDKLKKNFVIKSVKWNVSLKKISSISKASHPLKRAWRVRSRKFWAIALNLIVNSVTFRIVMITGVLGKSGRWYHRNMNIAKLLAYNRSYVGIARVIKTSMPIRRKWIPSSGKYRPLGITPIAWRVYTKGLSTLLSVFLANS